MKDVTKLIARQALVWEVKRRLEQEGVRPCCCMVDGVAFGPCLMISREHGSGGDSVARALGERLGWQVFDRQIVDEIAHRSNVREQLIQCVDEHTRSTWEETFRSMIQPGQLDQNTYLLYLRSIVLALGRHGDIIIMGRGAQFILPRKCGLSVRFTAPLEARVRHVAETEGCTIDQASREVQKLDLDRAAFIRKSFLQSSDSPSFYDLVLNTDTLSEEACVELVLMALRKKLGVVPNKDQAAAMR